MKRLVYLPLLLLLCTSLLLFSGCGTESSNLQESEVDREGYPVTIEDDLGRKVTVQEAPQRIVSLAPGNTEILFSLGLGDRVVGVTDYCDYPAEAAAKEKVGDFYSPSVEKIIALAPDVIFATGGIQTEVVQQLESLGQVVIAVNPGDVHEVMEAIERMGRVAGRLEEAQEITRNMSRRIDSIREKIVSVSEEEKPSAFVVIWIEEAKIFSAGPDTFVSSIISMAGGKNVADDTNVEYPQYSTEKLMEVNPQVIISTAYGYSNPEDVKNALALNDLKAVKDNRVFVIEDADLLTLPGPRIVEGLELTAQFLHPEIFLSD